MKHALLFRELSLTEKKINSTSVLSMLDTPISFDTTYEFIMLQRYVQSGKHLIIKMAT